MREAFHLGDDHQRKRKREKNITQTEKRMK